MSAASPVTIETPRQPVLKPEVQATIDTAVERLVAEFHPEQIWLFGSYAWGEPRTESDLDLVVVVRESAESYLRRAQRAQMCVYGISMGADIMVPTRAEFERFQTVKSSLTYKIINEGRLLYGSGNH